MNKTTLISLYNHRQIGFELWTLREQLHGLICPRFGFIRNRRLKIRLKKNSAQAVKAVDAIRDFLEGSAYHDLEGEPPFATDPSRDL